MKLKLSLQVTDDIRAAHTWWKANRPKAPRLLSEELRRIFHLLQSQPNIGLPAMDASAEGIRRFFLRGTRYHLYYSVNGDDVELLRLWHASRGSTPKF